MPQRPSLSDVSAIAVSLCLTKYVASQDGLRLSSPRDIVTSWCTEELTIITLMHDLC